MGGACGTSGNLKAAYTVLIGKLEGERPLGNPRCKCEDNMKTGRMERDWECSTGFMCISLKTAGALL